MKFSIKDFFILGAVTVPMFHSTCPKAKETKHTAKYLILKQVTGIFFRIQENFTNSWAVVHVSLFLLCIKKKNEDINLILLCSNYHSFISQNGHAHSNNSSANFRWIVWVFDHFVGLAIKGLKHNITPFQVNFSFPYQLKTIVPAGVFKGYRKGIMAYNG